ncbi:MAG: hypothetical protein IKX91_03695 [Firmicutes bacterium]|nr:hypothetical protein [Bacillota bacterium]
MILAFDTSNYTTSVALIASDGRILADRRRMLTVKEGERGLRQSDALFQHGKNLPDLLESLSIEEPVCAIAVSTRPRSVEGSYMPCFLAGEEAARDLAAVLGVPVYRFSHQDGHLAAASHGTALEGADRYLAWHLSGGTCELLEYEKEKGVTVIGGSLDISFGQLLDRTGVALGFPFPAGKYLDEAALEAADDPVVPKRNALSKVRVDGTRFNLSGLETQMMRKIGVLSAEKGKTANESTGAEKSLKSAIRGLSRDVLVRTAETVAEATLFAAESSGFDGVLFAGGVSSSAFLRKELTGRLKGLTVAFGEPALSADNAVGTGLLGLAAFKNDNVLRNGAADAMMREGE